MGIRPDAVGVLRRKTVPTRVTLGGVRRHACSALNISIARLLPTSSFPVSLAASPFVGHARIKAFPSSL